MLVEVHKILKKVFSLNSSAKAIMFGLNDSINKIFKKAIDGLSAGMGKLPEAKAQLSGLND